MYLDLDICAGKQHKVLSGFMFCRVQYRGRKNGGRADSVMKRSLSLVKHDKGVICSFLSDSDSCWGNKSVWWLNHNTETPQSTQLTVYQSSRSLLSFRLLLTALCPLHRWTDVLTRSLHQTQHCHTRDCTEHYTQAYYKQYALITSRGNTSINIHKMYYSIWCLTDQIATNITLWQKKARISYAVYLVLKICKYGEKWLSSVWWSDFFYHISSKCF